MGLETSLYLQGVRLQTMARLMPVQVQPVKSHLQERVQLVVLYCLRISKLMANSILEQQVPLAANLPCKPVAQ